MKKTYFIFLALCFICCSSITKLKAQEETNIKQDTTIKAKKDYTKLFNPENGKAIFVELQSGKDENKGTKDAPLKNLSKAIEIASDKDIIIVSEGVINESFILEKAVKIYGSFRSDFSERNIQLFPTLIQPLSSTSKAPLMIFTKDVDGLIIDGFIFDGGKRNVYSKTKGQAVGLQSGQLIIAPEKDENNRTSPNSPLFQMLPSTQGGEVRIQNNVFVNGSKYGILASHRNGSIIIENNVFISNRLSAINVETSCRDKFAEKCIDCVVSRNTILFNWNEKSEEKNLGTALQLSSKINYYITYNLIGASVSAGLDMSEKLSRDLIRIDNNTFFANKQADVLLNENGRGIKKLSINQLEDIDFKSFFSNVHEIVKNLKIDKQYLNAFLNTIFVDSKDFKRNSHAVLWRKALKIPVRKRRAKKSDVFANWYSPEKASLLFGNEKKRGAQMFY